MFFSQTKQIFTKFFSLIVIYSNTQIMATNSWTITPQGPPLGEETQLKNKTTHMWGADDLWAG